MAGVPHDGGGEEGVRGGEGGAGHDGGEEDVGGSPDPFQEGVLIAKQVERDAAEAPGDVLCELEGDEGTMFLVEGYDEKGRLIEKDESMELKERLLELVREGKKMRRDRRNVSLMMMMVMAMQRRLMRMRRRRKMMGLETCLKFVLMGRIGRELGEPGEEEGWIESGFGGEYWMAKASLS